MAAASAAIADFSRYAKPPPLGGGVFTFEVHFQELEVYFVKNKGLPMLFLAQCGQMTI